MGLNLFHRSILRIPFYSWNNPRGCELNQEVVGHNTVQVGVQPVQVGHTYTQEQSVHQPPAYTYVAEPAKTSESTVPVAPPVEPTPPCLAFRYQCPPRC